MTERHRVAYRLRTAAEGPDGIEQWWTVEKCKQRRVVAQGRILGVHQQCMELQLMSDSHVDFSHECPLLVKGVKSHTIQFWERTAGPIWDAVFVDTVERQIQHSNLQYSKQLL